jgi:hypothetical protein
VLGYEVHKAPKVNKVFLITFFSGYDYCEFRKKEGIGAALEGRNEWKGQF